MCTHSVNLIIHRVHNFYEKFKDNPDSKRVGSFLFSPRYSIAQRNFTIDAKQPLHSPALLAPLTHRPPPETLLFIPCQHFPHCRMCYATYIR